MGSERKEVNVDKRELDGVGDARQKEQQKRKTSPAEESELSEEDEKKKNELDALVAVVLNTTEGSASSESQIAAALSTMAEELRAATSSMTSVPKPLKFLRPHFETLSNRHEELPEGHPTKKFLADILSVLATTIRRTPPEAEKPNKEKVEGEATGGVTRGEATATSQDVTMDGAGSGDDLTAACWKLGPRLCLAYRVVGGVTDLVSWGQEYLRSLAGEIGAEYAEATKLEEEEVIDTGVHRSFLATETLHELIDQIVPYYMQHNAEVEAIDLLAEVETLDKIVQHVDLGNAARVVQYMTSLASYAANQEDLLKTLGVAHDILMKQELFPEALRVALRMCDEGRVGLTVRAAEDPITRKQLALMMFRQRWLFDWSDYEEKDESLKTLASGEWLPAHYLLLAKELDVLEPKVPEDVYKSHLEERRGPAVTAVDSAKQNLAATLVNAFLNAGFGTDTLMSSEDAGWLYKNKDHGMLSAAASLGVINLWNVNEGLSQVDKLQWSSDANVKAGAFMAFGLFSTTVRNEWDPAFVLLAEHLESSSAIEKEGAILGLGFAYAGTRRLDILEVLIPIIVDSGNVLEISAMAALSLGLIFVGSCNEAVIEALLQAMIDRSSSSDCLGSLGSGLFFGVGLGLLFLGKRDQCDATLEALEAVSGCLGKYAAVTVEGMAHAGAGDVLKVQKMLKICVEPRQTDEEEQPSTENGGGKDSTTTDKANKTSRPDGRRLSTSASQNASASVDIPIDTETLDQVVAAINLPLLSMGEETGNEMVVRMMEHLLQYSAIHIRRVIPLCIALQSLSNPKPTVVDTLSKLSHDNDGDLALNAILSLGLVGAGSNNSRIAGMLRQLAAYYRKDANALFTVRLAQGLVFMGKGLLTLNPVHSDRFLLDPVALGSVLIVLHSTLFLRRTILGRQHYLLYFLVPALYPRMLVTLDENLDPLPVTVRVGQAVDIVGQAGQPKSISGFQTHMTPVLLAYGERAEIATDEYLPATPILEGVVILRKNPSFKGGKPEGV